MNCCKCGAALPDDAVTCFVCGEEPRNTSDKSSFIEDKPHDNIIVEENVQIIQEESKDNNEVNNSAILEEKDKADAVSFATGSEVIRKEEENKADMGETVKGMDKETKKKSFEDIRAVTQESKPATEQDLEQQELKQEVDNEDESNNHENNKLLDEETKRKLGLQRFYREHVDYEAIAEAKRQKQDAILQKVVAVVVTFAIIGVVVFVVVNKVTKNKFNGYISSAEEAIKVKDYDKAFEELNSAKDVYKADEDRVAMVQAAAYVSMGDYERAMKVLLDTYKNNGENEEVYNSYNKYKSEYGNINSSAAPSKTQVPSTNESYDELLAKAKKIDDKASLDDKIAAYKKVIEANPIKSEAYEVIANLYKEAGKYDEAITLLNEGIVKCEASSDKDAAKNKELFEKDVKKLNDMKNGGEYTKICDAAQKAYKAGDLNTVLAKYKEAVEIDKTKQEIYVIVAKAYIQAYKYDDASKLLKDKIAEFTKASYEKDDLESAYKDCEEIKSKVNKYDKFYKQLYSAFVSQYDRNSNNELLIMVSKGEFSEIASSAKVTYYLSDGTYPENITDGKGLAVYSNGYMYFGNWKDGKRTGRGLYMVAVKSDKELNCYMYDGDWSNDLPDGKGKVVCTSYKNNKIVSYSMTTGKYSKGYENGTMSLTKKDSGTDYGTLEYKVANGTPQALTNSKGEKQLTADGNIIIGYYLKDGKKNKVASVKEGTVWKVEGLN